MPGKTEKTSPLTLLRNNSKTGEPFGGFHVDLSLCVETSEVIYFIPEMPVASHFPSKVIEISLQVFASLLR